MSTAAIIGGTIAGAGISAGASLAGAGEQADAAKSAAQLQFEEQKASLDFQKKVYEENVARQAPFLKAGTGAINTLAGLISTPGEGLLTPWTDTFKAPVLSETTDPGYAARLKLGETSLQNSAAARGGALSGGTVKDINAFAQDYASSEYGNVFDRAIRQYQQAYNIFENNQTNTFNRLAGVAGVGQATAQNLGGAGQNAATNIGNINLATGANVGRDLMAGATATASGYAGVANAFNQGVGNLSSLALLQQLLKPQIPTGQESY